VSGRFSPFPVQLDAVADLVGIWKGGQGDVPTERATALPEDLPGSAGADIYRNEFPDQFAGKFQSGGRGRSCNAGGIVMNGQRPLRRHRFSAGLIWYATFLALLVLAPAHGWAELCTGCVETALTAVPPGSPYPQYLADLPVWEPDGDRILYTRKDNISNTYKKNVYEVNSSNPLVERLRVQAPPYGQDFPAALAWGPGGTALIAEGHVGLYNEYLSFTVPTGTSSLNRTSTDGNGQGLTVKLKGNYVSSGPIGGMKSVNSYRSGIGRFVRLRR